VGRVDASPRTPVAVLARDTGGNEVWQLECVSLEKPPRGAPPETRALTDDPRVMNLAFGWMDDGRHYLHSSNRRDPKFFDVCSSDAEGGTPSRSVYEGDSWQMAVATRGERVLVGRFNTFLNVDLFLCGTGLPIHLNPHDGEVAVQSAAIGLDGVYAATNPDRELQGIFRYPFDGSDPELILDAPGEVEVVRASPAGDALLAVVNRDGWSELRVVDLASGSNRVVPVRPRGAIEDAQWLPDGTGFVYDLSWSGGREIFRRSLDSARSVRLTRSPAPPPAVIPEPKLRTIRAEDGISIPYWEYAPARGEPRGTLVVVHGGPEGQARPGFGPITGYGVSAGWRVIGPNVRGSTGYGRTYVHLDDVRRRMDSVRDLRDIVRALVRAKKATVGDVGIFGGSYGGFMVLSALTTYPELWGAGVEFFGIGDFVAFLERTAEWRRPQREAEYGSLARDREFLRSISPIHHLDRLRAPLLVAHGKNDVRVPFHEAEEIVAELRRRGNVVELLAFEEEGHGFARRENQLISLYRSFDFLAHHLPPKGRSRRPTTTQRARRSRRGRRARSR
jgi:dipeptidyl aminopeptidase/acylaminoacyl peptidase